MDENIHQMYVKSKKNPLQINQHFSKPHSWKTLNPWQHWSGIHNPKLYTKYNKCEKIISSDKALNFIAPHPPIERCLFMLAKKKKNIRVHSISVEGERVCFEGSIFFCIAYIRPKVIPNAVTVFSLVSFQLDYVTFLL